MSVPNGFIPLPDGCTWEEWSYGFKVQYDINGIPQDMPWNEFAERILGFDSIPELPNPAEFGDDWRGWARRAMMLVA